jgi:hypothetical protein
MGKSICNHIFNITGVIIQMKPIFHCLAVTSLVTLLLTACNLPQNGGTGTDTGSVETIVASTLAALTQAAQLTPFTSPSSPTSVQPSISQSPTLVPTGTMGPTNTQTPPPPPTATVLPTNTSTPGLGTIAGGIYGYPYGSVPALAIVAFGQEPPYRYWYLITGAGSSYFSMDGYITSGNYQVVAYDSSGHAGGCSVNVQVISNQTVDCDISNWGGGYPVKPSGVPTP